jgi:replicative DNA helicase
MGATDLRVIDGGANGNSDATQAVNTQADLRVESAVLANVMLDAAMLDEVKAFLKPEHFYSEAHRRMFEACDALSDAGAPFDCVSVAAWLRDKERLAQVGGSSYVTEVLTSSPACTAAQTIAHARHVRDRWVRRALAEASLRTKARCDADPAGIEQLVADQRGELEQLAEVLTASEKSARASHLVHRAFAEMQTSQTNDGRGQRPSGFDRLDRLTAGLPVDLMLVAARPGMGKTSLSCAIAMNVAVAGEGAFIASLETRDAELTKRILCAEARVSLLRCRAGMLRDDEWRRMTEAASVFAKLPLWIDDEPSMSVATLWAKARRTKLQLAREGRALGVVVVDYVQLLRAPRAGMKREELVAANARALKSMALDLQCCVLGVSQLNRECDKRPDKRPTLSDLRESGELEQVARLVLLLFREDRYRAKEANYQATGIAEIEVAKQNNGPEGMVRLRFDDQFVRFDNIEEGGLR